MERKAFDQWKVPIDSYNKGIAFYVECNCGEMADKVFLKPYFDCKTCNRRYTLSRGAYIEIENNESE